MTPAIGPSPAERYAASRVRAAHPAVTEFAGQYPFELDDFQVEACRSLEDGSSVLVCAPTGAGTTVVGSSRYLWGWPAGRSATTRHRSRRCRIRSTTTWSTGMAPTAS